MLKGMVEATFKKEHTWYVDMNMQHNEKVDMGKYLEIEKEGMVQVSVRGGMVLIEPLLGLLPALRKVVLQRTARGMQDMHCSQLLENNS
eukprot:2269214-Lingulodinium_polyedra.AAC.1